MRKKILFLTIVLTFSFMQFGCRGLLDTIENIQRLQFKLGAVNNFQVAGVGIGRVSSLNQLSLSDVAAITSNFANGRLPVSFTLNVLARNPNDGTGGTPRTSAILKRLDWRLLLDQRETIAGSLNQNIEVPGVGQAVTIPLVMSLDLLQFFSGQQLESLINLAMALGGVSGSSARITLRAKPTVDTFLGPITYPGEINIVDTEFRSE